MPKYLVNGKTGSRHIPLINSLPYVKDYLNQEHPHQIIIMLPYFPLKEKALEGLSHLQIKTLVTRRLSGGGIVRATTVTDASNDVNNNDNDENMH